MTWSSGLALASLAAAAAVAGGLAAYAWRQRGVPAARSFALLMVAVAVMAGTYGLQLASTDLPSSSFWGNVEYFGIVAVPAGWLAFALEYTGRAHVLNRRNVALLAVVPLVTLALMWTNDAHRLMHRELRLEVAGSLLVPAITHGPWFWVYVAYSYVLLLAGTGLLADALVRGGLVARRQGGAALAAALIPWAGNVLYLAQATPIPYLDLTPFAFTISGVIVAWDLFAFRLLDLVPVARETVLAGMRDGVIVVDARGRVVELNPAAEAIIERSARNAVGSPAARVLPEWLAALAAPAAPLPGAPLAVGAGTTVGPHIELRLGDGPAQRTYDLQITALRDRRGVMGGRLAVVRDVTERVRADDERARLLRVQAAQAQELVRREAEAAALRQVDRLKSDLLATVSHELRTPLTVVHGYAQRLVKEEPTDPERVQRYAERMVASSAQLVRLVDELLDFDRLERGEVGLRPEPFDLVPLLVEVLDGFGRRADGHSLVGEWRGPLWAMADRERVAQVVTNLIENALRYAGGRITLRAALHEAAREAGKDGDTRGAAVRVEVIDQGPGIAPDEQPRVWERFYRGRGVAELNVARGSGIGLAVVKMLVEAQGGRVGVESAPGHGACFWFELPAAPGAVRVEAAAIDQGVDAPT